jgi:outer membrane murein-binding lipoprotein Lpp
MSDSAAPKITSRRLAWLEPSALQRARLTVVPRRRVQASRFPFVTLVSLILLGGVISLLCFNTSMQQAAFTESRLEKQATTLAAQQQGLEMDLDRLRDPQHVAEAAEKQGMVIPGNVAMLHVDTGKVSGEPAPANGDVTPPLWPTVRKPTFH